MELTQKKSTLTFKALDGILRTTDPRTGERISMSHKCTELDRQIPMLLGVSKPILEHVVFCHQEDSSWPLMEGAVLKKRFDDIFDSTRYAKALKAIQETKKEYTGIVKDLKADLNGLASHKHAAKGFRQELTQQNEQLEELEDDLQECRKEIAKVEEEKKRNEEIAAQVEELRLDEEDRRAELDKAMALLDSKKSSLDEDLTEKHSARQLKDMMRDFEANVEKQQERKLDLSAEIRSIRDAKEAIRQEDSNLREQIGKLQAERARYEEVSQERLDAMDQMAQKYDIELPVSQTQNTSFTQGSLASQTIGNGAITGTQNTGVAVSKEDMKLFLGAVKEKEAEIKENLRNHREQAQKQMDYVQDQLNELNAKQKALEHGTYHRK
jgi:DNA repair protein RAD50